MFLTVSRVLQIARLYGRGMKDTDEILVRLFTAGYMSPTNLLRRAVLAEFQKARVAAARTGKGEAARPAVEELARKPFARDIEAAAAAATAGCD